MLWFLYLVYDVEPPMIAAVRDDVLVMMFASLFYDSCLWKVMLLWLLYLVDNLEPAAAGMIAPVRQGLPLWLVFASFYGRHLRPSNCSIWVAHIWQR
jgi:hypothetical protein